MKKAKSTAADIPNRQIWRLITRIIFAPRETALLRVRLSLDIVQGDADKISKAKRVS